MPAWTTDRDIRITGLPLRGTVLTTNAIAARIETRSALASAAGTALVPDAQRLVAQILDAIVVTPAS